MEKAVGEKAAEEKTAEEKTVGKNKQDGDSGMIIQGGLVFQEDKTFSKEIVYVENGVIVSSEDQVSDKTIIDAHGLRVIPGLIDVHSHGAVGHDFSDGDGDGLEEILRYEYSCGVTSYCPTTMAIPKEQLLGLFLQVRNFRELLPTTGVTEMTDAGNRITQTNKSAHIAGFNMEGPFLATAKKGAHRGEYLLAPDADLFRACNEACGNRIRLVTVAPECEGAMEFINSLKNETVIALGHTAADYNTAARALDAGASHVTHLYNAMTPYSHREPGLVGAAADKVDCFVELIADGIHVHESVVRSTFRMFPGRVVLISDSMRAAGLSDGEYELGGQKVRVTKNRAVLADGTIAGSVTNLYDCMRNAIAFGVPVEEAVAAATMNPAKSIDIYEETGSVTPGKRADLLLADDDMKLVRVL